MNAPAQPGIVPAAMPLSTRTRERLLRWLRDRAAAGDVTAAAALVDLSFRHGGSASET